MDLREDFSEIKPWFEIGEIRYWAKSSILGKSKSKDSKQISDDVEVNRGTIIDIAEDIHGVFFKLSTEVTTETEKPTKIKKTKSY